MRENSGVAEGTEAGSQQLSLMWCQSPSTQRSASGGAHPALPSFLVSSWLHHPPGSLWGFPLVLSLVASRPVDLCWQKRSPNSLCYCLAALLAAHSARMTKLLSVPKALVLVLPAGATSAIPHMPKSLFLGVI